MNIIQVSAYFPPRIGGMQGVVKELSHRLASAQNTVTVFTSSIDVGSQKYASTNKLRIIYLRGFEFANTAIIPSLPFALMRTPSNSIFHIHTPRPYVAEIAALIAKSRNIPYIVEVHSDIQPIGFFKFLIKPYKRYIWSWVLKHANKVIFLSDVQQNTFRKLYGLTNTVVIPNGVDKKYFANEAKVTANSPSTLLFVGRLNEQKDIAFLVKAMVYCNSKTQLRIVGEGTMHSELALLISKLGLGLKVHLVGRKSGKHLLLEYLNADIYVMASHFEGQSLAMLEAMAAALPVVALKAPGVTEHIFKVGKLVEKRDPELFANEISKILKSKTAMQKLSSNSHSYASSLTWDNVIKRVLGLYSIVQDDQP